jgi:hypothetical protein
MSYTYVHISCDDSIAIVELSAAPATLTKDTLKEAVSDFFADEESSASDAARDALEARRSADIRSSFASAGQPLSDAMAASAAAARRLVDITLLSVPRAPAFDSYSLYSDPDAAAKGHPVNKRATALAHATGHPQALIIRGDAFLGRCVDDEAGDVWERRSVAPSDAHPSAPWVVATAKANAGRSMANWSSSGVMAQSANPALAASASPDTGNGWRRSRAKGDDPASSGYLWKRSAPAEIEIKAPVPTGTRAKDVEVVLMRSRLGVRLKATPTGVTQISGPLGNVGGSKLTGAIDAEESNWTIDKDAVLVTLSLVDAGSGETSSFAWPNVFEEENHI